MILRQTFPWPPFWAVVCCAWLLLCSQPALASHLTQEEQEYLRQKGAIVFISQTNYPPFEFLEPDGSRSGMCIELARWMATTLGFQARFVDASFKQAQDAVLTGKADVLTSLFHSEKRAQIFEFSQMTFQVPASIFVAAQRPDIKGLRDLEGKTIAMQSGDYAQEFLESLGLRFKVVWTQDFAKATDLVISGLADAVIGDEQIVLYHLYSNRLTHLVKKVGEPLYVGRNCMAAKAGETTLRGILDKGLDLAISSGVMEQINRKWGGVHFPPPQSTMARYWPHTAALGGALLLLSLLIWAWNLQLRRTVRRRTAALAESEERFRVISEESPLGISLLDNQGRYEYVNPAFVKMFGYSLREVPTGEAWFELAYPDPAYRRSVKKSWQDDLRDHARGEARPRTYQVKCKDGGTKTILFRPVTIAAGQQFVIYEDISERLQAERQLQRLQEQLFQSQKLEAVGVLAGGIAHDFNNVLQAISGYTELMLNESRVSQEDRERLEHMGQYIARASGMIGHLMTLARKGHSRLERVDLNAEVSRTVKMLGHTLPRMISIRTELSSDLWPIRADSTQMEQVLLNLSANAAQAMPQGGELIFVSRNLEAGTQRERQEAGLKPGDYVCLSVSDTGLGMDEETLRHIFEPFFTTKPQGKGTGLGLSTVYGIVTNFGGNVVCRSSPGQGSTFTIYLPAALDLAASQPVAPHTPPKAARGSETILVVDDEAAILDSCRQALSAVGYGVLTAASGEEALETYSHAAGKISLVILDLNMPGMGGRRCLTLLRRADPGARVLVATGYVDEAVKEEISVEGAAGIIGKPYSFSDLLAAIRRMLDQN